MSDANRYKDAHAPHPPTFLPQAKPLPCSFPPDPDPEFTSLMKVMSDRDKLMKGLNEIEQILGQAIGGYPWYKDDQTNFPGATEKDGVCVGDHTPTTLAMEAAALIKSLREKIASLIREGT